MAGRLAGHSSLTESPRSNAVTFPSISADKILKPLSKMSKRDLTVNGSTGESGQNLLRLSLPPMVAEIVSRIANMQRLVKGSLAQSH